MSSLEKILEAAVEKKQKTQLERDRADILQTLGKDIVSILTPVLIEIAKKSSLSTTEIAEAAEKGIEKGLKNLKLPESKINVKIPDISIPEIQIPKISVPKIPIPKVNYTPPAINIPKIEMPKEMDIKGWVRLQGVDLGHPLPVQLRDASGKQVNLLENLTTIVGGGGGVAHIVKISDIRASTVSLIDQTENALRTITVGETDALTNAELRATHLDVKQLSGSVDSVYVNNPVDQGDSATALRIIQAGNAGSSVTASGISRTSNPSAIPDGDEVKFSADDLGRQLVRYQARDLIVTAYATLITGTETTLKTGIAGSYLDLIYIMGSNDSDVAVSVDIRAATGGNIQTTIRIPADGTAGVALPIPLPQDETGNDWTADLPDITGTTVTLSALFSQEK